MTGQLVAMTPLQHPGEGYTHAHDGSMIMLDLGVLVVILVFLLVFWGVFLPPDKICD